MKNKNLVTIAVCVGLLVPKFAQSQNFSGDGSSENPFQIATAGHLAALAEEVNGGKNYTKMHFVQTADIDLASYGENWNEGKGWIPIGHSNNARFLGNFDGAGYKISNLFISHEGYDNTGLFGYVYGGKVKNVGVVDAVITGSKNVGCVSGTVGFNGEILNCYAIGNVKGSGDGIGGVAGMVRSAPMGVARSNITNCYSICGVTGNNGVGGVAGIVMESTVKNCYATGTVSGNERVGGIAGSIIGGTGRSIAHSYATGAINGVRYVGGIAGFIRGGSIGGPSTGGVSFFVISDCVALNPNVSGSRNVARVVAGISGSTPKNNWALISQQVMVGGKPKAKLANTEQGLDGGDLYVGTEKTESWWSDGVFKEIWGTTDDAPWQWNNDLSRPILYWQLPKTDIHGEQKSEI